MESSYGSGIHHLGGAGLLKLRDLRHNPWNVDTLYVLTENAQRAHEFAGIVEHEVQRALGGSKPGCAIVLIWWD